MEVYILFAGMKYLKGGFDSLECLFCMYSANGHVYTQ